MLKGSQKFLNYKRDLLEADRIGEIKARQRDLKDAIKIKDLDKVKEASKQLHNTCEKSLRHYRAPDWLEENIEVFWVAIVVALGIRAYFLQPFRIPTGSMQPSLNGINVVSRHTEKDWEKPWIGKRVWDYAFSGKSYSEEYADQDKSIKSISDKSWFLFSRSEIKFSDGSSLMVSAPPQEVARLETIRPHVIGSDQFGRLAFTQRIHFAKGDPIFVGERVTGDLVLVDKMSYHFRNPKRGESFVFDTIGLPVQGSGDQDGGTHYIKRLAGVPGDKLQIRQPELYINDALAKEETFKRVMEQRQISDYEKYTGYTNPRNTKSDFRDPNHSVTLEEHEDPNYRQYFALGDNSADSSDSRMWGTVKQFNLVGPAFISLWPFGSGHWGFIK